MRRGYTDRAESLWGRIVDVVEAPSIEDFFEAVPWPSVLPESGSLEEAVAQAYRILNISDVEKTPVLGFRVRIAGQ